MKAKKIFCLFFIFFLFQNKLFSVEKGSRTAVSVQGHAFFPAADSDNRMLSFGWFKNGFTLQDSLTTCTFESTFSVEGGIAFNGGKLYLDSNLYFSKGTTFTSFGHIYGDSYVVDYAPSFSALADNDHVYTMHDVYLISRSDLNLTGTFRFEGNCSFDANGDIVRLGRGALIVVGRDSTLHLSDAILKNVCDGGIRCVDDTGKIVFQNICFVQQENFTFSKGAFEVFDEFRIKGDERDFVYNTSMTSTIKRCASLILDNGMTFSYNPGVARDNLIAFEEKKSSRFILRGSTLYTSVTGLHLKKGTLRVEEHSYLDSRGEVIIGNDLSSQDFNFDFHCGAKLEILSGSLCYRNIDTESWYMASILSTLQFDYGSDLKLYQSLDTGNGKFIFGKNTQVLTMPGKRLFGNVSATGGFIINDL
ncbi:hypothetical protein KAT08_04285 [Candidatus Babeliales bacterium]|nr:hypothetical protein [Candidatus Babeliales bacterium]